MNCIVFAVSLLAYLSSTKAAVDNFACDFEHNTCDWRVDHDEDGPWKRTKRSEEMKEMYHPDNSEYFMNLQCQTRIGRCKGRMSSSVADVYWNSSSSPQVRVSFWFLIHSPSNLSPSSLSLGFRETNRSVQWLFHSHQAFADCFGHWTFVTLCTDAVQEDMQFIFEVTAERYDTIGLDDISSDIVDGCYDSVPNILCVKKPTPPSEVEPHKDVVVENIESPRRRISKTVAACGCKLTLGLSFFSITLMVLLLGKVLYHIIK